MKKINKTMLHYLGKVKYYILIGTLLAPAAIYFRLKAPLIVGEILNTLLKEGVGIVDYPLFWQKTTRFLYCLLLYAVLTYASEIILAKGASKSVYYIQNDLFKRVLRFPVSYFDKEPAGRISSRVGSDPALIKDFFQTAITNLIVPLITIASIIVQILSLIHI